MARARASSASCCRGFFDVAQADRPEVVHAEADGAGLVAGAACQEAFDPIGRGCRPGRGRAVPDRRRRRWSASARSLSLDEVVELEAAGAEPVGQCAVVGGEVLEDLHSDATFGGLKDSGDGRKPGHAAPLHADLLGEPRFQPAFDFAEDFRIGFLEVDEAADDVDLDVAERGASARCPPAPAARCDSTRAITCGRSVARIFDELVGLGLAEEAEGREFGGSAGSGRLRTFGRGEGGRTRAPGGRRFRCRRGRGRRNVVPCG